MCVTVRCLSWLRATIHDTAIISGATSNAGGTVTYSVYSDATCTTLVTTGGIKTVTNSLVPNSDTVTFNAVGTFYWQAVYSGDANNAGATSVCTTEVVVVGKASPSIATTLSATNVTIGTAVTDSSALTGATANAGGTVTYTVFSDAGCSLNPQDAGTKTVTNGSVPNSDPITFNSAGTFYWQASYSGDANNNAALSVCTSEIVVVVQNEPTINTLLSAESVSIGTAVTDSAVIGGATTTAGGTVTYSVYTNDTCTSLLTSAGTKNVTNGIVPDSDSVTFNSAGTFYWQAVYSGDLNNKGATSVCTSERLVVNPNISGITTAQDLLPNDSATLTGLTSNAGGTITFSLFDPSQPVCAASTHVFTQTLPVSGNINNTYSTTNSTYHATGEGTWRWLVVYSGDANNVGSTSVCGVENFTITND